MAPYPVKHVQQAAGQHIGRTSHAGQGSLPAVAGHNTFNQLQLAVFLAIELAPVLLQLLQGGAAQFQGRLETAQDLGLGLARDAELQLGPYGPVVVVLQLEPLDEQGRFIGPLKIASQVRGLGPFKGRHPVSQRHSRVNGRRPTR